MDLLEHAQQLVARGQTNSQIQAHTAYLQELGQKKPNEVKIEIKPKLSSKGNQNNHNSNAIYLVSGLVLFGTAILAIGYWLGKRKSQHYQE